MSLLRHLPNAMTCGNLLCGCLGLLAVFRGDPLTAAAYIGAAAVLDFGDGFVARLLRVSSSIGKELDSLADLVTFGVLPTFILFQLMGGISYSLDVDLGRTTAHLDNQWLRSEVRWLPYVAFLVVSCSALRLAKFNIDTRQTDQFIGVPTPANALVVASFPAILVYQTAYGQWLTNPYALAGYSVVMSLLLVSELPLFALKFKTFGWSGNEIRFSFLGLAVVLLVLLKFAAVPVLVAVYIGLSLVGNVVSRKSSSNS
jgi:CDP-diacylglycerol--serine O-phosphatidyltransferase